MVDENESGIPMMTDDLDAYLKSEERKRRKNETLKNARDLEIKSNRKKISPQEAQRRIESMRTQIRNDKENEERMKGYHPIEKRDSAPPKEILREINKFDSRVYHTTDLEFKDISTEVYREYMYSNGGVLRVEKPIQIAISRSGNHRIITEDGMSYIVAPQWLAIRFKVKPGAANFSF